MIKVARRIFVVGRTGSGKSTLVRSLTEGAPRVICFDPVSSYEREYGWPAARNHEQLRALLVERWGRTPFAVSYVPAAGSEIAELHRLCARLWRLQEPFERGRERKRLTLVVEEANLGVPNYQLPPGLGGFMQCVLQGRHRGIEIIAVSQKPALVSKVFRDQCSDVYVLPVGIGAEGFMGRQFAAAIAGLAVHEWLHFSEAAAAPTRGKNAAFAAFHRAKTRRGA